MKKNILYLMPVILLLSIGLIFQTNQGEQTVEQQTSDELLYYGEACWAINGIKIGCNPNTVTNTWLNDTRDSLAQGAYVKYNHIALGNLSTPSATDTAHSGLIATCGLSSIDGTYKTEHISAGNWTIYHTWTSTCTIIVNTTGIYNDTNAGNYGGGTTITSASLTSGDTLQVNLTRWAA